VTRLTLFALLALAGCVGSAPPPIPLKPVRFLLVNDVYVADTIAGGRGGLARVATVRNRLADQGPILFVLAGDVLSPSLLSKYYSGRQMIEAFNAAKLNYATFGNPPVGHAPGFRPQGGSVRLDASGALSPGNTLYRP